MVLEEYGFWLFFDEETNDKMMFLYQINVPFRQIMTLQITQGGEGNHGRIEPITRNVEVRFSASVSCFNYLLKVEAVVLEASNTRLILRKNVIHNNQSQAYQDIMFEIDEANGRMAKVIIN